MRIGINWATMNSTWQQDPVQVARNSHSDTRTHSQRKTVRLSVFVFFLSSTHISCQECVTAPCSSLQTCEITLTDSPEPLGLSHLVRWNYTLTRCHSLEWCWLKLLNSLCLWRSNSLQCVWLFKWGHCCLDTKWGQCWQKPKPVRYDKLAGVTDNT